MVILDLSTVSSINKTFTPKRYDEHPIIFIEESSSLPENNMAK